jgi:membrane protease YdiL (CAAX protease family)
MTAVPATFLWGSRAGLVLALISMGTKAVEHRPLLSGSLGWPFFSAIVIAPLFEEFLFRGAVLGARKLSSRMRQFLLQIKLYWIACFGASLGGLIQTA